jgi:type I restriction enzyme R subunit
VVQLAFEGTEVPVEAQAPLKALMTRIVELLQDTIDVLDFWKKGVEVKKLRGNIDTEILLADIPALSAKHERIAVEVIRLAEKRHKELVQ